MSQDAYARSYLSRVRDRGGLQTAISESADHHRFMPPERRGDRYFYARSDATRFTQVSILVQEGRGGAARTLVDGGQLREREGLVVERFVFFIDTTVLL